jgi:hypothetical protein
MRLKRQLQQDSTATGPYWALQPRPDATVERRHAWSPQRAARRRRARDWHLPQVSKHAKDRALFPQLPRTSSHFVFSPSVAARTHSMGLLPALEPLGIFPEEKRKGEGQTCVINVRLFAINSMLCTCTKLSWSRRAICHCEYSFDIWGLRTCYSEDYRQTTHSSPLHASSYIHTYTTFVLT